MTSPEKIDGDRRGFFALAALPLLVFGLGSRARAAAAPAPACVNPATLTAGQASMRKGVNYRKSTEPQKRCGGCMYFHASTTAAGCGKCQILLNSTVSADDVCNSWTKKA